MFDVIVLLIIHGGAVDNYHVRINIPVFFNTDGIYEEFVFNSAMKLFASRGESQDRNKAFNDLELKMEFSRVDFVNLSARSKGLSSLIPVVANMTSSIQGAVFVDVTRKSLAYSAFLEGVSVPSVGLFRSENGFPITQVHVQEYKLMLCDGCTTCTFYNEGLCINRTRRRLIL